MKALYIDRHNRAVERICKAMRAGELGGDFMIADISDDGVQALGLDGSRIPKWLLPGVDAEGIE